MPLINPTREELKNHWRREVYRNLHKTGVVYSVRKNGIVEGHCNFIAVDNPVFAVGPKGNQRVRDEERKNVHAYIRGYMSRVIWHNDSTSYDLGHCEHCANYELNQRDIYSEYEWKEITYNPYKYQNFVTVEDEQPIFEARQAYIAKSVWALIPTQDKQETN